MVSYNEVRKSAYFDSVTLMLISSEVEKVEGVTGAAVMMGTDHNKALMIKAGLLDEASASECGANDLIIGITAENEEAVEAAKATITEQFEKKSGSDDSDTKQSIKSISSAVKKMPGANVCVVSLPGRFAKREAMKAMKNGMHVLLFSDNVTVEEENELKDYAVENGMLMMGPDCGTAIIGGTALGFANVVKRGKVGLVAAAGTGLQEVTVLLDKLGCGVSEAIGTGGRDVKEEVGGKMMLLALEALENDPATEVIGIISKPPAASVLEKIKNKVAGFTKPVVACLLGAPDGWAEGTKIVTAKSLKEEALKLNEVANDEISFASEPKAEGVELAEGRKYIRGLYTGGTLCAESELILTDKLGKIYSNIAHDPETTLADPETSKENTLVDMGDDHFTDGMAHPMIDPRNRTERIVAEADDPETAVILLDCVLGYGSHADPAGAIVSAIDRIRAKHGDNMPVFVASVCGTEADFQVRSAQEEKLQNAGVIIASCNYDAAMIAASIVAGK